MFGHSQLLDSPGSSRNRKRTKRKKDLPYPRPLIYFSHHTVYCMTWWAFNWPHGCKDSLSSDFSNFRFFKVHNWLLTGILSLLPKISLKVLDEASVDSILLIKLSLGNPDFSFGDWELETSFCVSFEDRSKRGGVVRELIPHFRREGSQGLTVARLFSGNLIQRSKWGPTREESPSLRKRLSLLRSDKWFFHLLKYVDGRFYLWVTINVIFVRVTCICIFRSWIRSLHFLLKSYKLMVIAG